MAKARIIEQRPITVINLSGRVPVGRISFQKCPSSFKYEYPEGRPNSSLNRMGQWPTRQVIQNSPTSRYTPLPQKAASVLAISPSTRRKLLKRPSVLPPNSLTLIDLAVRLRIFRRSEERRVGKECRSRWSRYH